MPALPSIDEDTKLTKGGMAGVAILAYISFLAFVGLGVWACFILYRNLIKIGQWATLPIFAFYVLAIIACLTRAITSILIVRSTIRIVAIAQLLPTAIMISIGLIQAQVNLELSIRVNMGRRLAQMVAESEQKSFSQYQQAKRLDEMLDAKKRYERAIWIGRVVFSLFIASVLIWSIVQSENINSRVD